MSRDVATRVTLPDGDPAHGTYNGYHHWGCRCFDCTEASRVYHAERGYSKNRRDRLCQGMCNRCGERKKDRARVTGLCNRCNVECAQ